MDYIPKGIANIGNTCFLNTILQILSQSKELNKLFDLNELDVHKNAIEYPIYQNWIDMRRLLHNQETKGNIIPRGFFNWFLQIAKKKNQQHVFESHNQCDTAEFLQFFVDCLHECIKRPMNITINGLSENPIDKLAIKCYETWKIHYENDYSELKDVFNGIMVSNIKSKDNTILSSKSELYFILDLPVATSEKKYGTLIECLDAFTESEKLEGENAWYNEKTKLKEDVEKQILFWNFPIILVICLKRFSLDGTSKEMHHVKYPLEIDLSKYVCGYHPDDYNYELFGICNHFGNLNKGHYTNFVKNMHNIWYYCDDENITEVHKDNSLQTNHAYCLFYRKKNSAV